jgi:outer membrane protein OmpA-like peptidoglycan-associated protein
MVVLASCQEIAEQPAASGTEADPAYPSLHAVPPRPQLSYTVEQRRAIVDGLVADRENARYSSQVARYRAGLSDLPPPAAPALAAVPPESQPEPADAADAVAPPQTRRDAPVVNPETEFLYEDDDLDSFMEEMVGGPVAPPGPAGRGPGAEPGANALPLGTRVIRASAVRTVPHAAYPGRPPVVTLAMPPATARLPVPAPVETTLAGRAPGVVWGMPDMAPPPDEPDAMQAAAPSRRLRRPPPAAVPVETSLAGRAPGVVWGMPAMTPPPDYPDLTPTTTSSLGVQQAALRPPPAPQETILAGRAPAVVWGMPDMAPASAGPTLPAAPREGSESITTARAAPSPAPAKPTTAPAEMAVAALESAAHAPDSRRHATPAPAPIKPAPPNQANAVLAGPPSAPVQMVAMPERPAAAPAETDARSTHAAPRPAPAKPAAVADATVLGPGTTALMSGSAPHPVPKPVAAAAEIEVAGGLVGIDAGRSRPRAAALGSVAFDPQSAMLTPHAIARLRQLLAEAAAREARIQVVGEAAAPGLALDRALAVGLALVQSGVPADRLELTLARDGSSDQAHLFLAAPAL